MSSSCAVPNTRSPKPIYQPGTPEAQRALAVVLKAKPDEHLCCYGHEAGIAEIGYWRRGVGLLGPSHFVTLGAGATLDEAMIAAAEKLTHPLILVQKPTTADLDLRELVELCAATVCPSCSGRLPEYPDGAVEASPRLAESTYGVAIYWHHYAATGKPARPCDATLLRTQAELFIVSCAASK